MLKIQKRTMPLNYFLKKGEENMPNKNQLKILVVVLFLFFFTGTSMAVKPFDTSVVADAVNKIVEQPCYDYCSNSANPADCKTGCDCALEFVYKQAPDRTRCYYNDILNPPQYSVSNPCPFDYMPPGTIEKGCSGGKTTGGVYDGARKTMEQYIYSKGGGWWRGWTKQTFDLQ